MPKQPHDEINCSVLTTDGGTEEMTLFIPRGIRVLDVLCDDRPFIPVVVQDQVRLIRKDRIDQLTPHDGERAEAEKYIYNSDSDR